MYFFLGDVLIQLILNELEWICWEDTGQYDSTEKNLPCYNAIKGNKPNSSKKYQNKLLFLFSVLKEINIRLLETIVKIGSERNNQ